MTYINATLNHFRAIQRWAASTGARASLDAATFELEVKHRNRYFQLHPQFIAFEAGRLFNVPRLTASVFGFAGWLPYRPYGLEFSTDKLAFKRFLVEAGLRTPDAWPGALEAERDFVLKRSRGSFGMQIAGPFRKEQRHRADAGAASEGGGELFAEAFVVGQILKVWFWGSSPFFAHVQPFASIEGDGRRSIGELARVRMGVSAEAWESSPELLIATACARYQGLGLDAVLGAGRDVWVDFRYGRHDRFARASAVSDNAMDQLTPGVRDQLVAAGDLIGRTLRESFAVPVAFALDGIADEAGEISWLEMNSNPILPPEGYERMFAELFA